MHEQSPSTSDGPAEQSVGPEPAAFAPGAESSSAATATVSRVLALQQSAGNRATAELIADGELPATTAEAAQLQRWTVTTAGGEQVEVSFWKRKKEKAEAEEIIKEIKDKYGIDVNSQATIEGIQAQYTDVPDKVKQSLKTRRWRLIELHALRTALRKYAPILGSNRAQSTRKDEDQEVTSVGKVKQAIDRNTPAGQLDTTTLGEYFRGKKNMGLFKASEGYKAEYPNEGDELTATFVHEIAHGLLKYALQDFIQAIGGPTGGYWRDRNSRTGVAGAEAPCTTYGEEKNAEEDLCETAAMYFVAPKRLKDGTGKAKGQVGNPCPLRYAFMEKLGKDWIPPPPQTPLVEDAPPTTAPTDGSGPQAQAPQGETAPPPTTSPSTDQGPPPPDSGESSGGTVEQPLESGDVLISGPDTENAPTETSPTAVV